MAAITIEMDDLRRTLKDVVREVLDERRGAEAGWLRGEHLRNAVVEAFEEIALLRAIEEGVGSEEVPRAEVMRALGAGA